MFVYSVFVLALICLFDCLFVYVALCFLMYWSLGVFVALCLSRLVYFSFVSFRSFRPLFMRFFVWCRFVFSFVSLPRFICRLRSSDSFDSEAPGLLGDHQ